MGNDRRRDLNQMNIQCEPDEPDKNGNEYVYKPTQFLTNSPLVAARLERKCDKNHKHAQLQGNRTKQAAIYPTKLIDAVTKGINDQIRADTQELNIIA